MKCPKCGYLGFETVDRCRNCGYEFALSSTDDLEYSIRGDERNVRPLDDLALVDAAAAPRPAAPVADAEADLDHLLQSTPAPSGRTTELPLFGPRVPDDEPLIGKPATPRPPLAVRRPTEVPRRAAEAPRSRNLDLDLDLTEAESTLGGIDTPRLEPWAAALASAAADEVDSENAPVFARLMAVVIDLAVLAVIDVVVIYFTMQICGITVDELGIVPKGPLLAFLLVQNGGYLVAFTAGGQTLGKMAAGIRVVATESTRSLDLPRAIVRTLLWIVLAIPAGLGFLTLLAPDRRGLHDRFAGSRVIRTALS